MADPEPKRRKADEEVDEDQLDEEEAVHIEALQDIQRQLDKVNDEASDRVLAVEQEYNKKRRPIFGKRAEVIANLPQFWSRCLIAHPDLADLVTQEDANIFDHITEVDVEDFEDIKSGFTVTIRLKENPFIADAALSKSYHYGDDGSVSVKPAVVHWKEGHEPTPDALPAGKRRKGPDYCFFAWLASDDLSPLGGSPDKIAEVLKEDIWPNPLKFYFAEDEELVVAGDEYGVLGAAGEDDLDGEDVEEVYEDEGEMEDGQMPLYDEGEMEELGEGEEELVEGEEELLEGGDGEGELLEGGDVEGEELLEGEEAPGAGFGEGEEDLGEDEA